MDENRAAVVLTLRYNESAKGWGQSTGSCSSGDGQKAGNTTLRG